MLKDYLRSQGYQFIKRVSKFPQFTRHDDFLAYGNYFTQLTPFLEVFNESEIYFLDGHQMTNDKAESEAREFEKYLGLDSEMQFRYDSLTV